MKVDKSEVKAARLAEAITQKQWYDLPGQQDLYSDGSASRPGPKPQVPHISPEAVLAIERVLGQRSRKLLYNPPAGDIRKKDLTGLWLTRALDLQDQDNTKALGVLQQKRETNLAKQTQAGLRTIGLNYDVTELSIIFRLAFKYADKRTSEEAQKPEVLRALAVLDAALKFDPKKVATGLGLIVKRKKTFGYVK